MPLPSEVAPLQPECRSGPDFNVPLTSFIKMGRKEDTRETWQTLAPTSTPILQAEKLRPREVKRLVPDNTAGW